MTLNLEDLEATAQALTYRGGDEQELALDAIALIAKLREAEVVIGKVREIVEPPKPFELGKSMMRSFDRMIGDLRRTLATYKPTNNESEGKA